MKSSKYQRIACERAADFRMPGTQRRDLKFYRAFQNSRGFLEISAAGLQSRQTDPQMSHYGGAL